VRENQHDHRNRHTYRRAGRELEETMSVRPRVEKKGPFVSDLEEIRRRAREHMELGAVTGGYRADRETVIRILNEVLATELVCVLRYKRHYYMATGIHAQAVAEEFLQHASEEQAHVDMVAERITQLGGEPNFDPEGLATRSHSQYVAGDSLVDMIREANPKEIHFLVSSPPITHPCFYGMDFPSPEELIANKYNKDIDAMAEAIGVDSLRYLSPQGLVEAVKESNPSGHGYCTACFTGDYPLPVNFGVEKEENEIV
jgi:rubrerythrin